MGGPWFYFVDGWAKWVVYYYILYRWCDNEVFLGLILALFTYVIAWILDLSYSWIYGLILISYSWTSSITISSLIHYCTCPTSARLSDPIQCTDPLTIQYDKLSSSFPVHIMLTQPIPLFSVFLSYPIYLHFSSEVLDPRSDLIWCKESYFCRHGKGLFTQAVHWSFALWSCMTFPCIAHQRCTLSCAYALSCALSPIIQEGRFMSKHSLGTSYSMLHKCNKDCSTITCHYILPHMFSLSLLCPMRSYLV
jgi:hypothetical protein